MKSITKSDIVSLIPTLSSGFKSASRESFFDFEATEVESTSGYKDFINNTIASAHNPTYNKFTDALCSVYAQMLKESGSTSSIDDRLQTTTQFFEVCLTLEMLIHALHRCKGAPFRNHFKRQYRSIEDELHNVLTINAVNYSSDEPPALDNLQLHVLSPEPWPMASQLIEVEVPAKDCTSPELLSYYGTILQTLFKKGVFATPINIGIITRNT
mgnify:CR=1 FL=1|tara:strand:- start:24749 stop:25387 length:639 start_codon:yes stop_codon:yes gene_type:complete